MEVVCRPEHQKMITLDDCVLGNVIRYFGTTNGRLWEPCDCHSHTPNIMCTRTTMPCVQLRSFFTESSFLHTAKETATTYLLKHMTCPDGLSFLRTNATLDF
jgi:hypothetical protein